MDEDMTRHLAAIGEWIAGHRASTRPPQGLSNDERKQLHAVERSIQQLAGLGVPIPDELRQLKLQLSAKDVVGPTTASTPERIAEVVEMVSALRTLTHAARALQNQLKASPGKGPTTKRRYEVTLNDLMQSGHLLPDDKLELAWKKSGPVFEGKVRADGTLVVQTSSGWKTFDSVSAAATAIGNCSLNGWLHWSRVNADGSRTTLKNIRANFINQTLSDGEARSDHKDVKEPSTSRLGG
mgnify:FL=1